MFDNTQNSSTTISTPANNRQKCKYCDMLMVQLKGSWDSFICINCGGKCVIHAEDLTIYERDNKYSGYRIKEAYKVVWTKIPVIDEHS